MSKKISSTLSVFVLSLLAAPAVSWGCAVCFTGTSDSVTDGFNASVLFLMTTPYLVVGSIVGGLIFAYRRALRKRSEPESELTGQLAWIQEVAGDE
jgi:hypothetical protein